MNWKTRFGNGTHSSALRLPDPRLFGALQAIGQAAILQGHRVFYREAHILLDQLADAVVEGKRKQFMANLTIVPLLIIDDFGMRKLPLTAAEDLLEIVAAVRASQHAAYVEPPRGGLGQASGGYGCDERDVGSSSSPWSRTQRRPAKLADKNGSGVDLWKWRVMENQTAVSHHAWKSQTTRFPHSHRYRHCSLSPTQKQPVRT